MEELSVKVSDSKETGRNMFEASWDLSVIGGQAGSRKI